MKSTKDIFHLADQIIDEYGDEAPAYATQQMLECKEDNEAMALVFWTDVLVIIMNKREKALSENYSQPSEDFSESEQLPIKCEIIWSSNHIAVFINVEDFNVLSEDKKKNMVDKVLKAHEKQYQTSLDEKNIPLFFVNKADNELIKEYA